MSDETDTHGLDNEARRAAERAREAADVAPPLNPPFPYRADPMPFDLFSNDL